MRKRHQGDGCRGVLWDGLFQEHWADGFRVSSGRVAQCSGRNIWLNRLMMELLDLKIKHLIVSMHLISPGPNCCTKHPYPSLSCQPSLERGHFQWHFQHSCIHVAQLLQYTEAFLSYKYSIRAGGWLPYEWQMGLGEREGSASMSMGKGKMIFFFFLIWDGPTEAWPFNSHNKT